MINGKNRTRSKSSKSNEIISIGLDGLPQKFKIVYLNAKPPYDRELVPIYKRCMCCDMALGRIEEEFSEELGEYCIGCFKNVTEQAEPGPFGEFVCIAQNCCKEIASVISDVDDPIQIILKQSRSPKLERKVKK